MPSLSIVTKAIGCSVLCMPAIATPIHAIKSEVANALGHNETNDTVIQKHIDDVGDARAKEIRQQIRDRIRSLRESERLFAKSGGRDVLLADKIDSDKVAIAVRQFILNERT